MVKPHDAHQDRLDGIRFTTPYLPAVRRRLGNKGPNVKKSSKVSCAVAAILSHTTAVYAQTDATDPSHSSDTIAEVTVTAQRRVEDIQSVPVTVQVLTGDTIKQLHVTTFDDFVKFLPNVTAAGGGPGQNNIYMRGLSTGSQTTQGSGGVGSFPNVAVYLDEQSVQVPGRNLDIYAADLERIEVLEGPQGTLFGAGAQAGVLRYITNKPKIDVTEGNATAGYATTAHGANSSNLDATINLPLIADTLAVRGVIYNEHRGGYIDNQPATFARSANDIVSVQYFQGAVPPNSGPINNNAIARNDINSVTYQGARASALWKINEDWNVLLTQSYQNMDAQGVFWEEQYDGTGKTLPPLSVELFNPSYNRDKFEDTQLVVSGQIERLKLLYAGSYLRRNVEQQQDYTNYSRGHYASYYQCNYPGYPFVGGVPTAGSAGYCYSPSGIIHERESVTHQSHELRASTPDEQRARALGGVFWEDFVVHDSTNWSYTSSPNFVPIAPPRDASSNDPGVRPYGTSAFNDSMRGYHQIAVFLSLDYDLIPKTLTLTGGARYYRIRDFDRGSNVTSFGCEIDGPYSGSVPSYPCGLPTSFGQNLDPLHKGWRYQWAVRFWDQSMTAF